MRADFDWFESREREYISDVFRLEMCHQPRLLAIAILVLVSPAFALDDIR